MAKTSFSVVGSFSYKGSKINFLFFLSFFSSWTSAIESVKSISSRLSNLATKLFQALNFLGVKIVGSFTGSKAREVLVDESYLETIKDDQAV